MGESTEKIIDGSGLIITIVSSEYNDSIVDELIRGAKEGLAECNVSEEDIYHVSVPGAFEIPLMVKRLIEKKTVFNNDERIHCNFDAIIALGCVIRGETSHYDLICNEVTRSLINISLDLNLPILHGILTTENLEQAKARSGEKMDNKGYECALSAVRMCELLSSNRSNLFNDL